MQTLTDSINNGKSDWKKMIQKKLLKEAITVSDPSLEKIDPNKFVPSSGETATPSEKSPVDMTGTTTSDTLSTMQQNISNLGDTPEYEQFRTDYNIALSKVASDKILDFIKTLKVKNLIKSKNPKTDQQIEETIKEFDIDESKALNIINQKIKQFNDTVIETNKMWGQGGGGGNLGTEYKDIPNITSIDDFKNIIKTIGGKSIMGGLLPYALNSVIGRPNVIEEEHQIDEALVGGGAVNPKISNVPSANVQKDTTSTTTSNFLKWLKRGKGLQGTAKIRRDMLIGQLSQILSGIMQIEVSNTVKEGLKQIVEKIKKFRELGSLGGKATAEKLKIKGVPPEKEEEINTALQDLEKSGGITQSTGVKTEMENIQTSKHGPGKIMDINTQETLSEQESIGDRKSKKLEKINEGWEKYKQLHKNDKNKEKPNDFSLTMG